MRDQFPFASDIPLVGLYCSLSICSASPDRVARVRRLSPKPRSSSSSVMDDESPEPADGPSNSSDEDDADDNVSFIGHT